MVPERMASRSSVTTRVFLETGSMRSNIALMSGATLPHRSPIFNRLSDNRLSIVIVPCLRYTPPPKAVAKHYLYIDDPIRRTMRRANGRFFLAVLAALAALAVLTATVSQGQGQRGARGAAPAGAPGAAARGAAPPVAGPKPLIVDAKPVRSCESLATLALPNTTIESAAIDPNNPGICRVTAITTHPPAGDK